MPTPYEMNWKQKCFYDFKNTTTGLLTPESIKTKILTVLTSLIRSLICIHCSSVLEGEEDTKHYTPKLITPSWVKLNRCLIFDLKLSLMTHKFWVNKHFFCKNWSSPYLCPNFETEWPNITQRPIIEYFSYVLFADSCQNDLIYPKIPPSANPKLW